MHNCDQYSEWPVARALLALTADMDAAADELRPDIVPQFAEIYATEPDNSEAWHDLEKKHSGGCELAIRHWLKHGHLPDLKDEEAYFLVHRFDQVSDYVQNLFVDYETIVSFGDRTLIEVAWWFLTDWWDEHGIRETYFAELEKSERGY